MTDSHPYSLLIYADGRCWSLKARKARLTVETKPVAKEEDLEAHDAFATGKTKVTVIAEGIAWPPEREAVPAIWDPAVNAILTGRYALVYEAPDGDWSVLAEKLTTTMTVTGSAEGSPAELLDPNSALDRTVTLVLEDVTQIA